MHGNIVKENNMNKNLNNDQEVNNSVFLMGTITKNPELKEIKGGSALCSFTMATENKFEGKDGKTKTMNNYHSIKAWGKLAHACKDNYSEGARVKLRGKLKTSSFEKNGQKVYQTSVELLQIKPQ